jgi:hypothetical protein
MIPCRDLFCWGSDPAGNYAAGYQTPQNKRLLPSVPSTSLSPLPLSPPSPLQSSVSLCPVRHSVPSMALCSLYGPLSPLRPSVPSTPLSPLPQCPLYLCVPSTPLSPLLLFYCRESNLAKSSSPVKTNYVQFLLGVRHTATM